jgi:hypothetical protein
MNGSNVRGRSVRRGLAIAAVAGFATVASIGAASALSVKDLKDKGYSCGKAGVGFTSCTKTVDGKDSEYYCSGDTCEHVSGPQARRATLGGTVPRGDIGPVK